MGSLWHKGLELGLGKSVFTTEVQKRPFLWENIYLGASVVQGFKVYSVIQKLTHHRGTEKVFFKGKYLSRCLGGARL